MLKSIKSCLFASYLIKLELTLAIIDEAGIVKSFLRRVSRTRNGGSITHPHDKQNFACGSLLLRHFVHWIDIDILSGCAPHQSQKRASALFKREHLEHVIIAAGALCAVGTETDARICYRNQIRNSKARQQFEFYRCRRG